MSISIDTLYPSLLSQTSGTAANSGSTTSFASLLANQMMMSVSSLSGETDSGSSSLLGSGLMSGMYEKETMW